MKNASYLFLPILFFFLASCEKEAALPEPGIIAISFLQSSSVQEPQEVTVKIEKPTPCHEVSQANKTVSGNTFSYDIILLNGSEICADVIAEETVKVTFDPSTIGEYTLNFLINGNLYETRKVNVTE